MEKKDSEKIIPVETVNRPTLFVRYFRFRNLLLINLGVIAVLTALAKINPYFPFDLTITRTIQTFNPPWFDALMKFMTELGNPGVGEYLVLAVLIIFALFKKWQEVIIIIASTTGTFLIGAILKTFVSRPRPDPTLILQIGTFSKSDSFPSGHVLFAMGLFGILLFLTFSKLKQSLLRSLLIVICLLGIILMGLSRIYLGDHWFSDTLASYLIGITWLYLMSKLYKRIEPKK